MDEAKINTSLSDLFHFLTKELHVDLPLCQNNPNNSVKIRFNSLDTSTAKEIAKEIIQATIGDSLFWVCEYGSISGETFSKIGQIGRAHV